MYIIHTCIRMHPCAFKMPPGDQFQTQYVWGESRNSKNHPTDVSTHAPCAESRFASNPAYQITPQPVKNMKRARGKSQSNCCFQHNYYCALFPGCQGRPHSESELVAIVRREASDYHIT